MIVMISDFPASIWMLELVRSAIATFPFDWFRKRPDQRAPFPLAPRIRYRGTSFYQFKT
jgi:hypothetical protein